MRKLLLVAAVMAVVICAVTPPAHADPVADRVTNTLSATAGTLNWTNLQPYASIRLLHISVLNDSNATNVVTFTRITKDLVWTQAVGSVTCSAGAGTTASFTFADLLGGDILAGSSSTATGGVVQIEYEVRMH